MSEKTETTQINPKVAAHVGFWLGIITSTIGSIIVASLVEMFRG